MRVFSLFIIIDINYGCNKKDIFLAVDRYSLSLINEFNLFMYKISTTNFMYHRKMMKHSVIQKSISKPKRCCAFNLCIISVQMYSMNDEWLQMTFEIDYGNSFLK